MTCETRVQAMVRRGETEVRHRIYTALDGELFKHDGDTDGDIQVCDGG